MSVLLLIASWLRKSSTSRFKRSITSLGSSSSLMSASFLISATRCAKRQVEIDSCYNFLDLIKLYHTTFSKTKQKRITHIQVLFFSRTSGNHSGHTIATQAVSQHRCHHGISIGHVCPVLLSQSNDYLIRGEKK